MINWTVVSQQIDTTCDDWRLVFHADRPSVFTARRPLLMLVRFLMTSFSSDEKSSCSDFFAMLVNTSTT